MIEFIHQNFTKITYNYTNLFNIFINYIILVYEICHIDHLNIILKYYIHVS